MEKKNLKQLKGIGRGITLISLVITIIILLILAGVSIAMLTGENGILAQAQNAKEETKNMQDIERIKIAVNEAQIGKSGYESLNNNNLQKAIDNQFGDREIVTSRNENGTFLVNCLDTLKDYLIIGSDVKEIIDWTEVIKNVKSPESQDEDRNKGVIGIGTDGKPVDMDLWEYTLYNGTYALNDLIDLEDTDGTNETKGYLGEIIDGKIQGTVPQYIKAPNDKEFVPVTNMKDTFICVDELEKIPKIPATVTDMQSTFSRCYAITAVNNLPSSIINMKWTFFNNINLKEIELPCKVVILTATFNNCKVLKEAPEIPESVTNMKSTFIECASLEKIETIPEKVETLERAFYNCVSLQGKIEINASNLLDYAECFTGVCKTDNKKLRLTGTCTKLNEIIAYTNNPNITL